MYRGISWCAALCAVLSGHVAAALAASSTNACALISAGEIMKATGLAVSEGKPGAPIPGVLGRCTWGGPGNSRVILTLADSQHMRATVEAQQASGGTPLSGPGSKAVGIKGAPVAGGGYIISVLDAEGGFGVSILGSEGTPDRVLALAKLVESHRH